MKITSQKYNSRKNWQRRLTLVIILTILIVAAAFTIYFTTNKQERGPRQEDNNSRQDNPDYTNNTQSNSDTESKKDFLDNESKNNSQSTPSTPSQSQITVLQARKSSNDLIITTSLSSISSGVCNLTILRSGAPSIIKSAQIIYTPESSSCAGFSIPLSDIGNSQELKITLSIKADNSTESISKTIDFEQ